MSFTIKARIKNMPIPNCTGPFKVGCVDVMTKDDSIPTDFGDPYSICSAELGSFFRLFYPCVEDPCPVKQATWVPEPNQKLYANGVLKHVKMNPKWFGWLSHLLTKNIRMHAYEHAPILDQASWQNNQNLPYSKKMSNLPLVLFSHGLGGERGMYSVFCTQLASEGFLVAAVEHRDASAISSFIISDGKTIEIPYNVTDTKDDGNEERYMLRNTQLGKRTMEVMAALDVLEELNSNPENVHNCMETEFDLCSLKNRINITNPLMIGHSFGGATTVNTLKKDSRLKCGIALDVWFVPLSQQFYEKDTLSEKPVLLINTERFHWRKNFERCEKYMANTSKDYVELITLKGTDHMDQSDIPGVTPEFISSWVTKDHKNQLSFSESISLQRKIILDYFGKYLEKRETPVKLLDENYVLPDAFVKGEVIYSERKDSS